MRYRIALVGAAFVFLGAGCQSPEPATPPTPPSRFLIASAGQFRFDEGTNHIRTGITNNSRQSIRVVDATIVWPGFSWTQVTLDADNTLPTQTAAFVSKFGAPRCSAHVHPPELRATIDGVQRTLPLRLDEPGLLSRLRTRECAQGRVRKAVRLTMTIGSHVTSTHGRKFFNGRVSLRRHGDTANAGQVSVVDLGGSVLFDVLPAKHQAVPARLPSSAVSLELPILVGPVLRCDAHARGNASQPFLFSVYTQLGSGGTQRSIEVPTEAEQRRLNQLLDEQCNASASKTATQPR